MQFVIVDLFYQTLSFLVLFKCVKESCLNSNHLAAFQKHAILSHLFRQVPLIKVMF